MLKQSKAVYWGWYAVHHTTHALFHRYRLAQHCEVLGIISVWPGLSQTANICNASYVHGAIQHLKLPLNSKREEALDLGSKYCTSPVTLLHVGMCNASLLRIGRCKTCTSRCAVARTCKRVYAAHNGAHSKSLNVSVKHISVLKVKA